MEDFEMAPAGEVLGAPEWNSEPAEDAYLDTYWEDQCDSIGDHDETNYDPYMGCDSWDYEGEDLSDW